jgi:hypothetical protein
LSVVRAGPKGWSSVEVNGIILFSSVSLFPAVFPRTILDVKIADFWSAPRLTVEIFKHDVVVSLLGLWLFGTRHLAKRAYDNHVRQQKKKW